MANFMRLMNTKWDPTPIDTLSIEVGSSLVKEVSILYPVVTKRLESTQTTFRYGEGKTVLTCLVELTSSNKTVISIVVDQEGYSGTVKIIMKRDARYFRAMSSDPNLIWDVLQDELDNYLSQFVILKGLNPSIIEKTNRSGKWTKNEILLLDNICFPSLEPVVFRVPGYITAPDKNSVLEFLLNIMLSSYYGSEVTFNTESFSYMFFNDKRPVAISEWEAEVSNIQRGKR
jgi:hypothetical protein